MKTYIIAEISCNHCQDYNLAVKTIKAAKRAGADAVKLQVYTPETMTIKCDNPYFKIHHGLWKGQTLFELYEKAYTPWKWIPKLMKEANKIGIDCFSTPFDKTAVDFLEKHNNPVYKIASFEAVDIPLIKYIAKLNKPIIISSGASSFVDISLAIETIKKEGNDKITVLYCVSSYPTKIEDMNIATLELLANELEVNVGISDHSKGSLAPIIAVSMGANMVEKHIILNKELDSPDVQFSLNPEEFGKMVRKIRKVEKMIGITNTEPKQFGLKFRRSLFAIKNIEKGDYITDDNIRSIRPGDGLHPKHYEDIIGKQAIINIEKGTPLRLEMFK